ncbi:MAG: hypothetical protein KTR21_07900 [Rhodobacteraceae bacterium]|nr:hypothetical protein [Paracoccaceae bacterium]
MTESEILKQLYDGLWTREMPETVAHKLAELPTLAADPDISAALRRRINARSRRTSMLEGWFEPVDLREKIQVAQILFAGQIQEANDPRARISPVERDPREISHFIQYLSELLSRGRGARSFLQERLNRIQRDEIGLELSNHAYNKRFRLLNRMDAHLKTYRKERRFVGYRLAGKVGLVEGVSFDAFSNHAWSAAFVAYHAARKRRRSVFTNQSQDRAFDDLSEMLLKRVETHGGDWALVARVHSTPEVLERLTDAERGQLIGEWMLVLRDLSEDLREIWRRSDINLESMIVKRGNDSSSWNIAAQAWNAARTAWLGLSQAMGADNIVKWFLPGKVLRLMAADVAAWHRTSGGGVHPDTEVWRKLPFPWEVMRGEQPCDRSMIERVCRAAGLDPERAGWSAPLKPAHAAAFHPTPELVHGVEVASPEIAALLRKAGFFSGKLE